MPVNRSYFSAPALTLPLALPLALALTTAIPAIAQNIQDLVQQVQPAPVAVEDMVAENRYRIGLDCRSSDATLKSHLHLDADTGLTVNMVLPNSPAAMAGLRQHDVIVEANGRPVGQVTDLVREVNEVGASEMSLMIVREGKETLVKVTPEERNEDEIRQLRNGFQRRLQQDWQGLPGMGALPEEFEQMFKQFPQLNQFGNGAFRRINPGFALPALPNVPDNFNLQVERQNDKVTVRRGDETYEVTIDTLDQLPEDIRPMVENMMNGQGFGIQGLMAPRAPGRMQGLPPVAPPANPNQKRMEDRFDGLELQLKQLQDAIKKFEEQ